jgi:hypothetical protein
MTTIRKAQLVLGDKLGEGGVGIVRRVDAPVPGLPPSLAYKELKAVLPTGTERKQVLRQMRRMVEVRSMLPAADRVVLDEVTVWPLAMVQHAGDDVGTLLRLIPRDFFVDTKTTPTVFELQFLSASDDFRRARGMDLRAADDDLVRLALMARLAYAIEVVHRHHLVFGDLNLKNAAAATHETIGGKRTEKPQILLMDCDGVAELSDTSRVQLHGPFLVPPENSKLQDQETDVFKLAVCVIRGLSRGEGATQLRKYDPGRAIAGLLDQEGIDLLGRAVGTDRSLRPTAKQLRDYLVARVLTLAKPPELSSAELSSDVVLRGSDVFVRWTQTGGQKVRIIGVGWEKDNLPAVAPPYGVPIKPPTSGPIFVEVSNKHGTDGPMLAGDLQYYELPPFSFDLRGVLPRLDMPDLPEAQLPQALAHLPEYPVYSTDAQPPPRFELPALGDRLSFETLAPDAPRGGAGPRGVLERAFAEASANFSAESVAGLRDMVGAVRKEVDRRLKTANDIADGIDI